MLLKKIVRTVCKRVVAIGSAAREEWFYEYNEHTLHFTRCMGFIGQNGIQGDILEFGVSTGESLIILDRLATRLLRKQQHIECRVFGFDSFQGMPEPQGGDRDLHGGESTAGMKFHKGMYKCTKENVLSRLKEKGSDVGNIQLIEGWYDKVLTPELREGLQIKRASLINIDCDFYESTIVALKFVEPLIEQGTIISFDDWFCYEGRPDHGEQRALKEFLEQNRDMTATPFSTYSWHGKSFIMNRK